VGVGGLGGWVGEIVCGCVGVCVDESVGVSERGGCESVCGFVWVCVEVWWVCVCGCVGGVGVCVCVCVCVVIMLCVW